MHTAQTIPTEHSIFDLFSRLKKNPPSAWRNAPFSSLEAFVGGYESGLLEVGRVLARQEEFHGHFEVWLTRKLNRTTVTAGWGYMILEFCEHDEHRAFEAFYKLLEEYLQDLQRHPREGSGAEAITAWTKEFILSDRR